MAGERIDGLDAGDLRERAARVVVELSACPLPEAVAAIVSMPEPPRFVQFCLRLLHAERGLRAELDANPFDQDLTGRDGAAPAFGSDSGLPAGTRLGAYSLVRLLGVGSTSHVYAARSEALNREVALKVLPLGAHRDRRSFRREALALSRLRHPDIVKVYDAGQCSLGELVLGWIAMELADGEPVTRALRGRHAGEHAAIMGRACRAIEHAHQRGVIHCDLKPGHVRVAFASGGEPVELRILDFGVARLIDVAEISSLRGVPGTIGYMSPEQLRGEPGGFDVRSDVFSLGAIFYELLAGEPCRDLRGRSLAEAYAMAREHRADPGVLVRAGAPPDLAGIALKALAPDAADRYANAGALADDLDRWLAGKPVVARPSSVARRCRLWVRRHKAPAVAIGIVLTALLVGAGGLGVSVHQSRRREDEVRRERERLVAALGPLRNYVRQLDTLGGTLEERTRTLETLIPLLDLPNLDLDADPQLARALADALEARCDLLEELGDTAELPALARRVVAMRERLAGGRAAVPQDRADSAVAWVKLGDVLRARGDKAEGLDCYLRAQRSNEALALEYPDEARFADDLTHGYIRLSRASLFDHADRDRCLEFMKLTSAARAALERAHPERPVTWRTSAEAHLTAIELWSFMGGPHDAEIRLARDAALASLRRLQELRPANRHDLELAVWITRNAAVNYPYGHEQHIRTLSDSNTSLAALLAGDPHRAQLWVEYLLGSLTLTESLCIAGRDAEAAGDLSKAAEALERAPEAVRRLVGGNELIGERVRSALARYPAPIRDPVQRIHNSLVSPQ